MAIVGGQADRCARGHTHHSPERGDEMSRRRKADLIRHLGNGRARFLQKADSPLEPAENDVPMRCHSRLLAECPDEVVDAQVHGVSQLRQRWGWDADVVQSSRDHVVDTPVSRGSKATVRGF
jgi:hypothetical protein